MGISSFQLSRFAQSVALLGIALLVTCAPALAGGRRLAGGRTLASPFQASLSSVGTAACVDDPAAATTTSLLLKQLACTQRPEETFAFVPQGDGSLVIHSPAAFSLCMDLNDTGQLVQNYCLATASQRWLPSVNTDSSYSFVNQQKNQCLLAASSGFTTAVCSSGATMQEFTYLGTTTFTPPPAPLRPTAPIVPVAAPSAGQWQAGMFQGLPYRIMFPAGYDPTRYVYSMALFLSGDGERGTDNISQLKNDMAALATDMDFRANAPMILLAPQCPQADYWGNPMSATPTPTETLTVQLVQALTASLPVDPRRVSVTGLSLGGIGTWDMINRYPAVFAAAAPLAGAGNIADVPALVNVPLLAVHGGADTNIPPTYDEAMYAAIHAKGGPMMYYEAPGVGHDVWDGVYPLTIFWQWMMTQVHI